MVKRKAETDEFLNCQLIYHTASADLEERSGIDKL